MVFIIPDTIYSLRPSGSENPSASWGSIFYILPVAISFESCLVTISKSLVDAFPIFRSNRCVLNTRICEIHAVPFPSPYWTGV